MSDFTALKQEREKERFRRDAHAFVFEACRTKDEHAASQGRESVQKFPDELCLRATLDLYLVSAKLKEPSAANYALATGIGLGFLEHIYRSRILFIEKS